MLKFNTKEVLEKAQANREKVPPKPNIRTFSKAITEPAEVEEVRQIIIPSPDLLDELWQQMGGIKRARARLSSSIAKRVRANAPESELIQLHDMIQGYTDQAKELFFKIKQVEETGSLPTHKQIESPETSFELKDRKRKLTDFISKTRKKLEPSAKKVKAEKQNEWKLKLAMAEEERDEIDRKLKQMGNE